MEIHSLAGLRDGAKAYVEFLRTGSLSAGVYRLPAGAVDGQSPHTEEEIYFVTAGRARFASGDRDTAVRTGDVVFVPAGEAHRFHSIEEDLEVLVFFAPAEGSQAG